MEKLYIGSDNLVTVDELYDVADASYLSGASVEATLRDRSGTEVTGVSWPISLSYVSGSDGKYRGNIPDAASLSRGKRYELTITVDAGTNKAATFKRVLEAEYRTWT